MRDAMNARRHTQKPIEQRSNAADFSKSAESNQTRQCFHEMELDMENESKCPVTGSHAVGAMSNQDWWPNQLNLKILNQNSPLSDPMDRECDYAKEFNSLDLNPVLNDLHPLITDSQHWWPT